MREIADVVWKICQKGVFGDSPSLSFAQSMETLEAMIVDGWVLATLNPKRPLLRVEFQEEGYMMEFVDPN
jgi:hypothetical protein